MEPNNPNAKPSIDPQRLREMCIYFSKILPIDKNKQRQREIEMMLGLKSDELWLVSEKIFVSIGKESSKSDEALLEMEAYLNFIYDAILYIFKKTNNYPEIEINQDGLYRLIDDTKKVK